MAPKLVKLAQELAVSQIEKGERIDWTLFCQSHRDIIKIPVANIFLPFVPPPLRRVTLQTLLERTTALAYALVGAGWGVHGDKSWEGMDEAQVRQLLGLAPNQPVKEHPDRREIVLINYQHMLTGKSLVYQAEIHRHNNESWLGELTGGPVTTARGLIMNLFDNPKDWKAK